MFASFRLWAMVIGLVLLMAEPHAAQETPPPVPTLSPAPAAEKAPPLPPPPANAVAATVNGHAISELAVYRGLLKEDPKVHEQARKEILNYLIDNTVIDQYLGQLKVEVEPKDIEERIAQIKAEAAKGKQDFAKLLATLHLTEEDLRRELTSSLRWDKFVVQQSTDKALRDMFDKNKNMFDGSQVSARHILVPATADTAQKAQARLVSVRKEIEDKVNQEVAKLPATTDALTREKERVNALEKAFAAAAEDVSTCPTKEQGGNVGWFPRAGRMVEPFARAAFALKPYQLSDAVPTEFGYHLILATATKPGKDVKFEDVRPYVMEIYAERIREAILVNYKPRSKIVINAPSKN